MNLMENDEKNEVLISELIESDNKLLKEKGIKLQEIKKAKEKGWTGLSLDELNYDVEAIYNKLVDAAKNAPEIDKDTLSVISLISSIRKDKIELIKFMHNHNLKLKELEYRYEGVKKTDLSEVEL